MFKLGKITEYIGKRSNLRQAVGILVGTTLISNILGLARNIIIANRVGISYGSIGPLDSYYAAFALPDLLFNIIIVGALSAAIVPLLVEIDTNEGDDKFWGAFNTLVSNGLVLMTVGVIILYFIMPHVIPHYLPGFSQKDINLTIQLAQVLLLSPLIFTVSQVLSSALQARKIFLEPAIAPLIYNICIISSALLIPRFGIQVLPIGVITGALGHLLIQLPTLIKEGWHFKFDFNFRDSKVVKAIKLMIPRTISLTSTQLLLIAFYQLASSFSKGSIAIYRLTDDLQTAPVILIANSISMAVFPEFSRHISTNKHEEFTDLVGQTIRLLIFLFLPIMIFLFMFRQEIINVYIAIGHGVSISEISIASATFGYFVLSIFFQGAILILARAYFARSNTKTPTIISITSIIIAYIFGYVFSKTTAMGPSGLSLAFSIGSAINATLLWIWLKLPSSIIFKDANGRSNFIYIIAGSLVATVAFYLGRFISLLLFGFIEKMTIYYILLLITSFATGMLAYWLTAKWARIEQWRLITQKTTSTES